MGLKVVSKPPVEPITLTEAKSHLRVTHNEEDNLIESLIQVAREKCEAYSNRSYVQRTLKQTFHNWPDFPAVLKRPPVQEITKIEYKKEDASVIEWDASNYFLDDISFSPKVFLAPDYNMPGDILYPANAIQITYKAGYQPDDTGDTTDYTVNIPERYKHAIKLLIGEWWENREEIIKGTTAQKIPDGVQSLLMSDRVMPV